MFLALDGIDGTGKSTQHELLCDWLRSRGLQVVACRDPGTTTVGEAVRSILLSQRSEGLARRSEMLLYMAARAQLVAEVIEPALEAGHTVVSDRYLLANVVYQGHAGGLDVETVWSIGKIATEGLAPNLTVVLDMPQHSAQERLSAGQRDLDRMELQGDAFRAKLREGYRTEARRNPKAIVLVDAQGTIDEVHARIRAAVSPILRPQDLNR